MTLKEAIDSGSRIAVAPALQRCRCPLLLEMAAALLRYHAPVHVTETDFNGTPLSWAEHGAEHGWYRTSGDYPGRIAALVGAGASRRDRP